ncbi:MAG: DUF2029 domain-containing protein, partial [Sphingomonas sp.]|nr:DUF2029 domain-containing protein [Sphingomonas sp.]
LPALAIVAAARSRDRRAVLLVLLIVAGLIAALLPEPTWRQYLMPVLPPLFVRLAMAWQARPPGRTMRIVLAVFVGAGLATTVEGVIRLRGLTMVDATAQAIAIGRVARAERVTGPVATLSPQFLPAAGLSIDPRFAAGSYYFRTFALLDPAFERPYVLVSRARIDFGCVPPAAILIGGEGAWTSGDAGDDAALEAYAVTNRWRRHDVPGGRFRLYTPPYAAAACRGARASVS